VGKQIRFQVLIRNSGNAPATGIVMNDRFDPGLSHLRDPNRSLAIENKGVGPLAPGEQKALFLTFDVLKAGQLCHDVTVTSLEGARDQRRACITAIVPPPQLQPGLDVIKDGDRLKNVGETALFTVVVKNTGQVPLLNVQVVDEYNGALQPRSPGPQYQTQGGRILWQYQRLGVGESKEVEVECLCLQPSPKACSLVKVTAEVEGSASALVDVDDHCVEIAAGPQNANPGAAAAPPRENLQMEILSFVNPARAGTGATYQIVVKNNASVADEQVTLRVLFPPEMTPDATAVQATVQVRVLGNELQFEPVATLRPGERLPFTIPVTVNRAGQAQIQASLASRNMPQGIRKTETVEIIGR